MGYLVLPLQSGSREALYLFCGPESSILLFIFFPNKASQASDHVIGRSTVQKLMGAIFGDKGLCHRAANWTSICQGELGRVNKLFDFSTHCDSDMEGPVINEILRCDLIRARCF